MPSSYLRGGLEVSDETIDKLHDISELLFHPKRLIIMSYLVVFGKCSQGDLRKRSKLNWGQFSSHLKQLQRYEQIETEKIVTEDGPRVLVHITPGRLKLYSQTMELMKELGTT